jgi:hypothetical protein
VTVLLSDSFAESADKALASHAPGVGGTWMQFSSAAMSVVAAEGRARGSDAGVSAVYYNSGASAANLSVAATVRRGATANEALPAVFARLQTSGDNRYALLHNGSSLVLQKRVGGTTTTLATASPSFPADTDCTIELRVNGQELVALWNGAGVATVSDGSIAGAGLAGIGCRLNGRIDDVVAQTIAWGLTPGRGAHGCGSDASAVAVGYALTPGDAAHPSGSDASAVAVGYALAAARAAHGGRAGAAGVSVRYALGPADAGHPGAAGASAVAVLYALAASGARHALTGGAAVVARVLEPPVDGIRESVAADARVLRVGADARVETPRRA